MLGQYLHDVVNIPDVTVEPGTGNAIIDAVISTKMFFAKQSGVKISAVIAIPAQISVSNADICTVLGNMLDNAITAVSKLTCKSRKIRLEIRVVKSYLSIMCVNLTDGNCIANGDGLFLTTKENEPIHGHGIKAIHYVAQKNRGYFHCTHYNNWFRAFVLLPLSIKANQMQVFNIRTL